MPDFLFEEVLLARTILYRFLALGFHEPRGSLVDFLATQEEMQALVEAADQVDEVFESPEVRKAVQAIIEARSAQDWPEQDLRVEYTRLFLGPGKVPCQPYESLYDETRSEDERGTVQGPSAFDMEELLEAEGLVIELGYKDLADHIAIELEFMYYLLHQAVEAGADPGSTQIERSQQFLRKHLAHWLPNFGERVAKNARHPFFLHLGSLLSAFMRFEGRLVEQV